MHDGLVARSTDSRVRSTENTLQSLAWSTMLGEKFSQMDGGDWFGTGSNGCCSSSVEKKKLLHDSMAEIQSITQSNSYYHSRLWIRNLGHWSTTQIPFEVRSNSCGGSRLREGVKRWFFIRSEQSNEDLTARINWYEYNTSSKDFGTLFATRKR